MSAPRGTIVLLITAFCALGGCFGSLFRSKAPPATVYQLNALPPSASAPAPTESIASPPTNAASIDLAVLRPRVRTGLDNDLINVLYPDQRLDFLANSRWSGPIDEVIQDLALQAYRVRVPQLDVHARASAFGSAYWLELDVVAFQAEYTADRAAPPVAHVHMVARLGTAGDRRIIDRLDLDAREPAAENRVSAIVAAYNRAVDDVLDRLVAATTAALPASGVAAR